MFLLVTLLGGVSNEQVVRVFLVTLTTALMAGSLGSMLGFWRGKTFQTLALTALTLVLWTVVWQAPVCRSRPKPVSWSSPCSTMTTSA